MHGQDPTDAASSTPPPLPEGSHVFMGYGSIESLLQDRDPSDTQLYMFPGIDHRSTAFANVHRRAYFSTLSLVDAGVIHYCRIRYAEMEVVTDHAGQPVGDCLRELARIDARGVSLDSCIGAYLVRRGFAEPRYASPSFPVTLHLVDGSQRVAVWDDAKSAFVESEVRS